MVQKCIASACALALMLALCGCHGHLKRKIHRKHHKHHGPDVKIHVGPGKIKVKP
ncbi:MAG: hypothetical protein R3236_08890 [Phycisphaeraceae bacterium]|nr:hypothetical protein [Phycisphaeraceae bacterium]